MTWKCLIVDLTDSKSQTQVFALHRTKEFALAPIVVSSVDAARAYLDEGKIAALIIHADRDGTSLQLLLSSFQANVGLLGSFQAIVCDEPSPSFIANVFEYGVDTFIRKDEWEVAAAIITQQADSVLRDDDSPETKTIRLTRSVRTGIKREIDEALRDMDEFIEYDFRAAFATGKAYEATSSYEESIRAFEKSIKLNNRARSSYSSLGEALLLTGRTAEAIKVFSHLERTNPTCSSHKANLAAAFLQTGDIERATEYAQMATSMNPEGEKIKELNVHMLINAGEIEKAVEAVTALSEVGTLLSVKLNETGIKLSKSGNIKGALKLYNTAHRIVRPDQRYKISLNAALACYRGNHFDSAIRFLSRCETEFGGSFSKLDRIKETIVTAQSRQKVA